MNNGIGNVVLADVSKRFGAKEVLSHLDLTIEPGRFTALVGPSGCGKSTLINLIAGYEEADSGSVSMDGRPVRCPDRERSIRARAGRGPARSRAPRRVRHAPRAHLRLV